METIEEQIREIITSAAFESDRKLAFVLDTVEKDHPELQPVIDRAFDEVAIVAEGSDITSLKIRSAMSVRRADGSNLFSELAEAYGEDLAGVELQSSAGDRYAIFLADASNPGMVRYQVFAPNGFYSHSTHKDYEAAVKDAFQSGFRHIVQGKLTELSETAEFRRGNEVAARIQLVNSGEIPLSELYDGLDRFGPIYTHTNKQDIFLGIKSGEDLYYRESPGRPAEVIRRQNSNPDGELGISLEHAKSMQRLGEIAAPLAHALQVINERGLTVEQRARSMSRPREDGREFSPSPMR